MPDILVSLLPSFGREELSSLLRKAAWARVSGGDENVAVPRIAAIIEAGADMHGRGSVSRDDRRKGR